MSNPSEVASLPTEVPEQVPAASTLVQAQEQSSTPAPESVESPSEYQPENPEFQSMNGVFAIAKPTGVSSAKVLAQLQQVFNNSKVFAYDLQQIRNEKVGQFTQRNPHRKPSRKVLNSVKIKMGHGGTLDMGASGILVVGVGRGTKKLQNYLTECTKAYDTRAVLGASTTSGDFEGELLKKNEVRHITKEQVFTVPERFTGTIVQTPPIFSALKIDGKPLYEYAREKKPLPKPIKSREVKVLKMELVNEEVLTKQHQYKLKKPEVDDDGKSIISKLAEISNIDNDELHYSHEYVAKMEKEGKPIDYPKPVAIPEDFEQETLKDHYVPPLVRFKATVSSGTYIRSLVSDFGKALGTSAYMVSLSRTMQGEWVLGKNNFEVKHFQKYHEDVWGTVLRKVLSEDGSEINVDEEIKKENEKFLQQHPEEAGKTYFEEVFQRRENFEQNQPQNDKRRGNDFSRGGGQWKGRKRGQQQQHHHPQQPQQQQRDEEPLIKKQKLGNEEAAAAE